MERVIQLVRYSRKTGSKRQYLYKRKAPASRFVVVDIIRTVSIAIVVLAHSAALGMAIQGTPLTSIIQRLGENAVYGVTIFFVVSGFIITKTIHDRNSDLSKVSSRDFYGRRIARLLPLALIVITIGVVLVLSTNSDPARDFVLRDPNARFDGWFVLSFPLLIFNWVRIAYQHLAGGWGLQWDIFWSLAIEEQFYLLYPLILKRYGHSLARLAKVMMVIIGVGITYQVLTSLLAPDKVWLGISGSPAGFGAIAFGVLAFIASDYLSKKKISPRITVAVVGVSIVLASIVFWGQSISANPMSRVYGSAILSLSIGAILAFAGTAAWSRSVPRIFTQPGVLCYGIYLLHPLVMFLLFRAIGAQPAPIFMLLSFAATFALASLSYRLIESPANKFLRKKLLDNSVPEAAKPLPAPTAAISS